MKIGQRITITWEPEHEPKLAAEFEGYKAGDRRGPFTLRFGGGAYDVDLEVLEYEPGRLVGRIISEPVARN